MRVQIRALNLQCACSEASQVSSFPCIHHTGPVCCRGQVRLQLVSTGVNVLGKESQQPSILFGTQISSTVPASHWKCASNCTCLGTRSSRFLLGALKAPPQENTRSSSPEELQPRSRRLAQRFGSAALGLQVSIKVGESWMWGFGRLQMVFLVQPAVTASPADLAGLEQPQG